MTTSTQHYARDLQRYYRLPATQVSLTVVLSLLIIAIFIVFALGPTIVAIITLQKNITDSQTTLQQLETKITTLQTVNTKFESFKTLLPTLNTSIPNTGAMDASLATTIEALAGQTNVKLQSESIGATLLYSRILSPFAPNKNQKVVPLSLTAQVVGSYAAVSTFLSQLLSLDRVISIDTITISKEVSSKQGDTIVTLDLSGNAFYLADDAQLLKAIPDKQGVK